MMIEPTVNFIKKNAGASISVVSIVAVLSGYTLVLQHLDARYCLANDAQQTKQLMVSYMERELLDKIFLIDLKIQKRTATEEDVAMKERYKDALNEIRKQK